MRVLILSCKTGGGHNAAGKAVQEAFERQGDEAVMLEYLTLAGNRVNDVVGDAYIGIAKNTPWLFGIIYCLGMRVGRLLFQLGIKSPVYYANALMAGHLAAYLKEQHFDAILMPHLYPAETITHIRRNPQKYGDILPMTFSVGTDYTCIPFWEETDLDYYIVPHHDLQAEYVSRGVPRHKLLPLGIPVSLRCNQPQDVEGLKKKLSVKPHQKCILVMGGSMGFGDLNALVAALKNNIRHCHIIVVCGNNHKMERTLRARYIFAENVSVIGYTKYVAALMKMSTVVYTKAGGLTSTEAAVSNCPIVFTDSIPGCEDCNRRFFVKRGMGVSGDSVSAQVAQGRKLLNNAEARERMRAAQKAQINANAAKDICRKVHVLCNK